MGLPVQKEGGGFLPNQNSKNKGFETRDFSTPKGKFFPHSRIYSNEFGKNYW